MLKVIRNHARTAGALETPFEDIDYEPIKVNHRVLRHEKLEYIGACLKDVWNSAINSGEKFGFRNAQVSVLAPTGTISFAMDCASTSIEPFFSHVVYKKII